jgi:hypothetical protein
MNLVPWKVNPSRLVELAEMIPFRARYLYVVLNGLQGMCQSAARENVEILGGMMLPDSQVPADKIGPYRNMLDLAEAECERFGLSKIIIDRIVRTREALAQPVFWSTLKNDFRVIHEAMLDTIREDVFLYIEPDKAKYYQKEDFHKQDLFGEDVSNNFPSARDDIRAAGNCYATDNATACVFHLMRAVEWGFRALCSSLGLKKVRQRYKATGAISYIPIEYSEWEKLLDQLKPRIDKRIDKIKRGPLKQQEQEFYYPILQDIRGIKDAWRNHIMHARQQYSSEDAKAIFGHVENLMIRLATRIKEV